MISQVKKLIACAVVLGTVSACGSGGGSGNGGASPPNRPGQLVLTSQNANQVGKAGIEGAEAILSLSIAVLDNLNELADIGELEAIFDCGFGEDASVTLIDNDFAGTISAGDVIQIVYSGCFLQVLDGSISGRVDIEVESFTINSDLTVSGSIVVGATDGVAIFKNSGASIAATGDYAVTFSISRDAENISVSSGSTSEFVFTIAEAGETAANLYENISVVRSVEADGEYSVSLNYLVDTDFGPGSFTCRTPTALQGMIPSFPEDGTIECTGQNNSRVRTVANPLGSVDTLVDSAGDGTFVAAGPPNNGSGTWADYVEGRIFDTRLDGPKVDRRLIRPVLTTRTTNIPVNDVVYNANADTLLVSNDSGIVELDSTTLAAIRSVAIQGRPGPITISDDSSTFWVGLQDTTDIVSIDAVSMAVGTPVSLGTSANPSNERFASDILVAPGTTDTLVVAMRSGDEVIVIERGLELPNAIDENSSAYNIRFHDSSTIVAFFSDDYSMTMNLDEDGVTKVKEWGGQPPNDPLQEAIVVFEESGQKLDVANDLYLGRIALNPLARTTVDAFLADDSTNLLYAYNRSSNFLAIYDQDRLTAVGAYTIFTEGLVVGLVEAGPDRMILAAENEIHSMDKSWLAPTLLGDPCKTEDLSGQLGPDLYIEIQCQFSDAIYDATRNLIYASMPADAGPNGNSIAIIDPLTGSIQSKVYVGSEPTHMAMSGTGDRLFIVLSETSFLGILDLQAQTLEQLMYLPPMLQPFRPFRPERVTVNPINSDEIIVAADEMDMYRLGQVSTGGSIYVGETDWVGYRSDGSVAFTIDDNRRFYELDPGTSGLSVINEISGAATGYSLKMKDDLLYDIHGRVFDPATLSSTMVCPTNSAGAVEPNPENDVIYFWEPGSRSYLIACDGNTGSLGPQLDVPGFSGVHRDVKSMIYAGPTRLFLVTQDKSMLFDPAELE